jgi:uncharacterized radical SAM protein YgiQ
MLSRYTIKDWLPITKKEIELRGWENVDIIIISGDAYVDHPGFGSAVIGRVLEHEGYKVAILPQPNWRDDLRDFKKLGKPRLFFGVSAGCMDSMVNHYTAYKRLRSDDAYTPGGEAGFRPDYATVVYSQILKKLYPDVPVVIGGIEASLRRFTHYDFWSDSLKPSILAESKADILVYGMGEKAIVEIASSLNKGIPVSQLSHIPQTAILRPGDEKMNDAGIHSLELASHEACLNDKIAYAKNFTIIEQESNKWTPAVITQKTGGKTVVVNPPYPSMTEREMDTTYDLPYTRMPHPKYDKRGTIPAYEMIRHSVTIHRGCFGGCAFCTISAHQGKFVSSRSESSILKEVRMITEMPDFKGYITDLGGPSANMYRMTGTDEKSCKICTRYSCIFPNICKNLNTDHRPMTALYKKAAEMPDIKKVYIGSGVRYDLFTGRTKEENKTNGLNEYFTQLVTHHVSGRLKVAPEHTSDHVLKIMRKPSFHLFFDLKSKFDMLNKEAGLNQQIIPYFISGHPGCTLKDMAQLAVETKKLGYRLEQVQGFTPTPMTLSTDIYYTGINPYTSKPLFVARSVKDKLDQTRFFFWYKPENAGWVKDQIKHMNEIF